jgi:hypothetical protein
MISFSRLKKWLENKPDNGFVIPYSQADKEFNEFYNVINHSDYIAEKEVSNEYFHGFIDFIKDDRFLECKIRSNHKLDKWFVLQAMIYENITGISNWFICIYDRKENYKEYMFCKNNCGKYLDWAKKVIDYVIKNFAEIDKLLDKSESSMVIETI